MDEKKWFIVRAFNGKLFIFDMPPKRVLPNLWESENNRRVMLPDHFLQDEKIQALKYEDTPMEITGVIKPREA